MLGGLFESKSSSKSKTKTRQNTTGEQTDLSPELLQQLENLLGGSFSGFKTGTDALTDELADIRAFDVDANAEQIANQAIRNTDLELESDVNQLIGQIGGGADSNSMAALLRSRLQNDASTTRAGIIGNAKLAGRQYKTGATNQTANSLDQAILSLLSGTRGAKTQGTLKTNSVAKGKGSGTASDSPFDNIMKVAGLFKE